MLLGLLKPLYHIGSVIYKVSNVRIVCCWVSNPVKSNQSKPERGMERQPAEKVRGFQQKKTQLGDSEQAVGQLVRTRDVLTSLHHQCQSYTHTDFSQKGCLQAAIHYSAAIPIKSGWKCSKAAWWCSQPFAVCSETVPLQNSWWF